ncbi:TadE family protein [Aquipuribacter sp. MA13-6]|uniref:TadE family protein n=2 Tax=unclassified Aquipuribacter TaxID=2635084 RepID=UPI003EEE7F91
MQHPLANGGPRRRRPRGERGSATVWLLLLVPALVFATGLVVDGGRAIAVRQEAIGLASQAARAAIDQMDLSGYRGSGGVRPVAPGAAQSAACTWISEHRPDARCAATTHGQGRVEVTVTLTFRPVLLGAAGVGERAISASAQARPAVGDTEEVTAP